VFRSRNHGNDQIRLILALYDGSAPPGHPPTVVSAALRFRKIQAMQVKYPREQQVYRYETFSAAI